MFEYHLGDLLKKIKGLGILQVVHNRMKIELRVDSNQMLARVIVLD